MAFDLVAGAEPIPGYTLQARLGAGGYGEVWKVSAPGGLTKAIKFVYGRMSDMRASRELKALSRIREVRHPFLLSVERFEVLDGQLIIVTELADESLLECYEARRATGLHGIPRDELLMFLHDAADALDHMSDAHGLQHLDIKPENLLLVGGRVKVADFGLVKDLQDSSATMIGGVTPVYAAPEAFDGRASRHSDQYSLAITYQEMLTGVRPFPGTTAAQLAVQHINSPPMLSPLPPQDRPAIARALSKQPELRFPTCRELLETLMRGAQASAFISTPTARQSQRDESNQDTRSLADQNTQAVPSVGHSGRLLNPTSIFVDDVEEELEPTELLPPLVLPEEDAGLRPTLFLGVGGTAASTLRRLRARFDQRFGSETELPAFGMLYLDTDQREIQKIYSQRDSAGRDPFDALLLPLRKPEDYRKTCDALLGWLSRRWLYNIPRSLRTEGLRPLGRLALVDNFGKVSERIRQQLQKITRRESKETTAEIACRPFHGLAPRVYVIASTAGATGGGMAVDLAYTVRGLLNELGFASDSVIGILAHSTGGKSTSKDLARANSYATLREINHFARGDLHYPGDAGCGIPEFAPHVAPFEKTYLVDLGEDLNEHEFEAATDTLAEYLWLDTMTRAGSFFTAARTEDEADQIQNADKTQLRTFGGYRISFPKNMITAAAANLICQKTIKRWRGDATVVRTQPLSPLALAQGGPRFHGDAEAVERAEIDQQGLRFMRTLGLDVASLSNLYNEVAERALGVDLGSLVRGKVPRNLFCKQNGSGDPLHQAFASVHGILGTGEESGDPGAPPPTPFEQAMDEAAQQLAKESAMAVCAWITRFAEDPSCRIRTAVRAAEWFTQHLTALRKDARAQLETAQSERQEVLAYLVAAQNKAPARGGWFKRVPSLAHGQEDYLVQYGRLRAREIVLQKVMATLQHCWAQASLVGQQFPQLRQRLSQIGDKCQAVLPLADFLAEQGKGTARATNLMFGNRATLLESAEALLEQLGIGFLHQFDVSFQRDVFDPAGGFRESLMREEKDDANPIWRELITRASLALERAMHEVNAAQLFIDSYHAPEHAAAALASYLQEASPRLTALGGKSNLLVMSPAGDGGDRVRNMLPEEIKQAATQVPDADGDVVFCYETHHLPLAQVAARLIRQRPDYIAVAQRIMTRCDIQWTPIARVQPRISDSELPVAPSVDLGLATAAMLDTEFTVSEPATTQALVPQQQGSSLPLADMARTQAFAAPRDS